MTTQQPTPYEQRLREEFLKEFGPDTDQMVSAHQSFMPDRVADYFITKHREYVEKVSDKIGRLKDVINPLHADDHDPMLMERSNGFNQAIERVLQITNSPQVNEDER
jgi:hypothetical protein